MGFTLGSLKADIQVGQSASKNKDKMAHLCEILGLISGAAINFDEFAIGSRTQAVRNFVLAVEVSLAGY